MDVVEREEFHPAFQSALAFVVELHAEQTRKETDIPYISHLIGVAGLVLEHGGNRDETIAALLHDSIEDQGHAFPGKVAALRAEIQSRFGSAVLAIVEGCTDSDSDTGVKPPWQERKERYIAHLAYAPASVRLVSCADKLHNARAIVSDMRILGDDLFGRFNGGKDGTLWYYESLAKSFRAGGPTRLANELDLAVKEMRALAG